MMNLRKILFGYLCLCFFIGATSINTEGQSTQVKFNNADKATIVKYILENIDFRDDSDADGGTVYLSTANIPNNIPFKEALNGDVSLKLLTPQQIESEMPTGFLFFYFDPFLVKGNEVTVTFNRRWSNSSYGTTDMNGTEYKCRRYGSKWKCRVSRLILEMS